MNGNTTDRLSQKDNCRKEKIGSLLENAAEIARRVLSSIQALAGTTACKGVQIAKLKDKIQQEIIKVLGNTLFVPRTLY